MPLKRELCVRVVAARGRVRGGGAELERVVAALLVRVFWQNGFVHVRGCPPLGRWLVATVHRYSPSDSELELSSSWPALPACR